MYQDLERYKFAGVSGLHQPPDWHPLYLLPGKIFQKKFVKQFYAFKTTWDAVISDLLSLS